MKDNDNNKRKFRESINNNRFYQFLKRTKRELDIREQKLNIREEKLEKLEEIVKHKSEELNTKEADLFKLKSMLEQNLEKSNVEIIKKENIEPTIDKETKGNESQEKKTANQYLMNEFAKLTEELHVIQNNMISLPTMSKEEEKEIKNEYAKLKGRFYGLLAALQEVKTPNELKGIMMFDDKISLGDVIEKLHETLPISKDKEEKHIFAKSVCQEYKKSIDSLNDIGFLKGQQRDRIDYDFTKGEGLVMDGATWILNTYFNTDYILDNRTFEAFHPLRNFTKDKNQIIENKKTENVEIESMLNDFENVDKKMENKIYQKQ